MLLDGMPILGNPPDVQFCVCETLIQFGARVKPPHDLQGPSGSAPKDALAVLPVTKLSGDARHGLSLKDMEVSSNGGTKQWMVLTESPTKMNDFGGTPHFGKPPY